MHVETFIGLMGVSSSVHDLLADDPAFEPVECLTSQRCDNDVEGGGARGDAVNTLEIKIGLPPIKVGNIITSTSRKTHGQDCAYMTHGFCLFCHSGSCSYT